MKVPFEYVRNTLTHSNHKPPVLKLSNSKKRYLDYLRSECSESFGEWIKNKMYLNYQS